jgi:hypothetical protein
MSKDTDKTFLTQLPFPVAAKPMAVHRVAIMMPLRACMYNQLLFFTAAAAAAANAC